MGDSEWKGEGEEGEGEREIERGRKKGFVED